MATPPSRGAALRASTRAWRGRRSAPELAPRREGRGADALERVGDVSDGRDMIEIDPERGRRDLVDDARYESENAVIADALIVEGRQHQHAAATVADGVANEARRLARRAGAGSGHQLFG